jgi:hypothetical protein
LGEEASKNPRIALSRALDIFLNGQVTAGTRQALEERIDDQQAVQQVNEGLIAGLVLGSPEFERR